VVRWSLERHNRGCERAKSAGIQNPGARRHGVSQATWLEGSRFIAWQFCRFAASGSRKRLLICHVPTYSEIEFFREPGEASEKVGSNDQSRGFTGSTEEAIEENTSGVIRGSRLLPSWFGQIHPDTNTGGCIATFLSGSPPGHVNLRFTSA